VTFFPLSLTFPAIARRALSFADTGAASGFLQTEATRLSSPPRYCAAMAPWLVRQYSQSFPAET
jgi:hypothetical protein